MKQEREKTRRQKQLINAEFRKLRKLEKQMRALLEKKK